VISSSHGHTRQLELYTEARSHEGAIALQRLHDAATNRTAANDSKPNLLH
jgi:hypothetical protein